MREKNLFSKEQVLAHIFRVVVLACLSSLAFNLRQ